MGDMLQPKVSVIIPVYNVDPYLRECLESVVNQTLLDIEIICVNDGSTDNSPAILEEYRAKDSRITVFTQENRGLSAARNRGMDLARGEYIYFIDSDDYVEPETLERTVHIAEADDLDAVVFRFKQFAESEELLKIHPCQIGEIKNSQIYSGVE